MNFYANGEPVTKERIQDESWYPDYQSLMQMIAYGEFETEEDFLKAYEDDYKSIFKRDPTPEQHEQFKRWANYHWELNEEYGVEYGDETVQG